MKHLPRYAPPGEFLAEITQRCLLGFFLLLPSKKLNELVAGALAKAQELYEVDLVALAFLSNHFHLLVTTTSHRLLSSFMNLVASRIALEAGQLYGWRGRLWARRFQCAIVSNEEAAQVARLKYCLSQGCKEGLVSSPRHWPGLHAARALLGGRSLGGIWIDRTGLYRARLKLGDKVRPVDFRHEKSLRFVQLPCWAHLSADEYQARVREMVEEIEQETAAMHQRRGTTPLGRRAVLRQKPLDRAGQPTGSRAPRIHAASRRVRERFLEAYLRFVQAFRQASARYRRGDLTVRFPEGCFPPARPFIEAVQGLKPG